MFASSLFQSSGPYHALVGEGRRPDLDILRGIAILGIFFLNAPYFIDFANGYVPPLPLSEGDAILTRLSDIALEGRFRGLFLVLFALGLVIQWQRCYEHEAPIPKLQRRLLVLLGFGFAHSLFIWAGDILIGYAIAGLLALPMLANPRNKLTLQGIAFLVFGSAMLLVLAALSNEPQVQFTDSHYQAYLAQFDGNFWRTRGANAGNSVLMLLALMLAILWQQLGMVLLVVAAWRSGWLVRPWPLVHTLALISALLGCAYLSSRQWHDVSAFNDVLALVANSFSGFCTALIAVHLLYLWSFADNVLTRALASVGKMSLSCYLSQSLFMVVLIHFFGSEMATEFQLRDYLLLSALVSAVSLIICPLYLRAFKQGPAEWLWRHWYRDKNKKINTN
ncbi:DUF418 domain-containing protein [Pseudoalteromonas sp. T1lg10]|uniref:DUF418 domain-containing protein n=1 Tax=Pseudoalteromonas sp. T1lg10 TaxID=2077093 RepID=UPI001319FF54|nr:DUF418 domain-containing protein [Pseudoalteromonas sp. T1lg10]